jgi:hypothetical protein
MNKITFGWGAVNSQPGSFSYPTQTYPGSPGTPFEWSGSSTGVAPAASYFTPNTKPPADVMNYLLAQVSTDLLYLAEFTSQSPASTTIASASNGASLPTGTIHVQSTNGFASSGSGTTAVFVLTSAGPQQVTYTGITANTFTGCSGGTGTMATGNAVGGTDSAGNSWGASFVGPGGTALAFGTQRACGVAAVGGVDNGNAFYGQGYGTGYGAELFGGGVGVGGGGLIATGGGSAGVGVTAQGSGTGAGITASGDSRGTGVGGAFFAGQGGNADGLTAQGNGGGAGGAFLGGINGPGITAEGGSGNYAGVFTGNNSSAISANAGGSAGDGIDALGAGTGVGVFGLGGSSGGGGGTNNVDGAGGYFAGGGSGAFGAIGVGGANGPGLQGFGGTGNSVGVSGLGTGTGPGGNFTGGAGADAPGLFGTGGSSGGPGAVFQATGSYAGMTATGAGGGAGGTFQGNGVGNGINATGGSGAGSGAGGAFTAGTSSNDSIVGIGGPIYPNCSAPTSPVANRLYKDNIPKAFLYAVGTSGAISTDVGMNLSVSGTNSTSVLLAFNTPMANANYAVMATCYQTGVGGAACGPYNQTASGFEVGVDGFNPSSTSFTLSIVVFGQQ